MKSIYIIIDSGAKFRHTHHTPLIQVYSRIIEKKTDRLLILLPKYADKRAFSNTKGEKKYFLISNLYGPNFYENFSYFILFKGLDLFVKYLNHDSILKKFFRSFLVKKSANFIYELYQHQTVKICLVFPTTETLNIDLASTLVTKYRLENVSFIFRIVGSESRGSLASGNELKKLLELSKIRPEQIKVGYETDGFNLLLQKIGFRPEQLYWSPWPQLDRKSPPKQKNTKIVIGFLGTAKRRKGFDLIPDILEKLENDKIGFEAIIQKAVFPWEQYHKTLSHIESNFKSKVRMVPSELSLTQLQIYIKECDVLILPYDPVSYAINASGLLYHGADYHVPIITFKNVGFESEIINNKIGYVCQDINEIPKLILRIYSNQGGFEFEEYNSSRDKANTNLFY